MINNKKHSDFTRHSAGFTLIETLLAIAVLTIAITGPLTIAATGLNTALIAKDQTTAYNLAQDAIEYVRFIRDSNRLTPGNTDWLAGLDGAVGNGHTNAGSVGPNCTNYAGASASACAVDAIQDTTSTNNGNCSNLSPSDGLPLCSTPLQYDSGTGQYGYTTGSQTIFTRSVLIECLDSATHQATTDCADANEAMVRVTVQWHDVGGTLRQVVVSENMFNWQ